VCEQEKEKERKILLSCAPTRDREKKEKKCQGRNLYRGGEAKEDRESFIFLQREEKGGERVTER